MTAVTVTTQDELDTALADPTVTSVDIQSTDGVWLSLGRTDKVANVRGGGWANVSDGGRANVRGGGWANVSDGGRANVSDGGRANVSDGGRANVSDGGWADVRGASTVHAYDGSDIRASSHVAVHLHSGRARVHGGVIIDHTSVDQSDPATWCSYHGVTVKDGHAVLVKAVRDDWRSGHGTSYEPGTTASCDDFRADGYCGGGLHLSPTPWQAGAYDGLASRYVEVRVPVGAINVIGADKVKAAAVQCVREVDIDGRPIVTEIGAST